MVADEANDIYVAPEEMMDGQLMDGQLLYLT